MSTSTLPTSSTGVGHLEWDTIAASVPLLPRNAGLALLHAYRATISHVYGDV